MCVSELRDLRCTAASLYDGGIQTCYETKSVNNKQRFDFHPLSQTHLVFFTLFVPLRLSYGI